MRLQILQVALDVEAIQTEHWQLYDAIAQRDVAAATQSVKQHLELSKARVVQVFTHAKKMATDDSLRIVCPSCDSSNIKKNGRRQNKQNYLCKACGRQFVEKTAVSRR